MVAQPPRARVLGRLVHHPGADRRSAVPPAYIEVSGHSMDGTYKTGDLILTRSHDTYAKGDIIVYDATAAGQVIHRIIGGNGATGYTTQGDNNPDPDPWHPTDDDVVGQAWHRFEGKAWILHLPRQPWFAGVSAGLLTLLVLGWDARPRRRDDDPAPAEEATSDSASVEPRILIPLQRSDSNCAWQGGTVTPVAEAEPGGRAGGPCPVERAGRAVTRGHLRVVPASAVALLLLVPLIALQAASAAQLSVSAAPIQTWTGAYSPPATSMLPPWSPGCMVP